MADFRKAGLDRGDIKAELKHLLISARIRKEEYANLIDELELDELEFDLREYKYILENEVMPLFERAMSTGVRNIVELAQEVRDTYDEIIRMIEEKLSNGKRRI